MKFWKKTACLALCATMSVGVFAGCGEGGTETEAQRREKAAKSAKSYVQAVSDTLESAKSLKASGTLVLTSEYELFGEDGVTIDATKTYKENASATFEIELTQDGDKDIALYLKGEAKTEYFWDNETHKSIGVTENIIKDGYVYERFYQFEEGRQPNPVEMYWDKSAITLDEDMEYVLTLAEKLMAAKEVEEFADAFLGECQEIIAEKFFKGEVVNGETTFTLDLASEVWSFIELMNSIDETKDTLGATINKVLAKIDPTLTAEGIIAVLKNYKDKTVTEALTELDAALAKHGTSLQKIYDEIVNSEVVSIICAEPSLGIPADTLATLKAFKIDTIKQQYGTMKLGEVVNMLLQLSGIVEVDPEATEPVDYFGQALTMVEQALGLTLEELDMEVPEIPVVAVNKLSAGVGFKLNAKGNALESVSLALDFGMKVKSFDEDYDHETGEWIEYQTGYQTATIDADFVISSFATTTLTITAPADEECRPS